jgi:hypothetical protein
MQSGAGRKLSAWHVRSKDEHEGAASRKSFDEQLILVQG